MKATDATYEAALPLVATRTYVYASYVDEPVMMVSGAGTKSYFHQNHLYSVAAMTNSTGAIVERYRYDAYGKRTVTNAGGTTIAASTIGQQRGFTGYYEDAETGLYYARARMYSAGLGRFVSRDPAQYHDGMQLYLARMVPNKLDPSGMVVVVADATVTMEHPKGDHSFVDWINPLALRHQIGSQAAAGSVTVHQGQYTERRQRTFGVTTYEFTATITCQPCQEETTTDLPPWEAVVVSHDATIRYGYDRGDFPTAVTSYPSHHPTTGAATSIDRDFIITHEAVHALRAMERWVNGDTSRIPASGYRAANATAPIKKFQTKQECVADVVAFLTAYEGYIYTPGVNPHVLPDYLDDHWPTPDAIQDVGNSPLGPQQ